MYVSHEHSYFDPVCISQIVSRRGEKTTTYVCIYTYGTTVHHYHHRFAFTSIHRRISDAAELYRAASLSLSLPRIWKARAPFLFDSSSYSERFAYDVNPFSLQSIPTMASPRPQLTSARIFGSL